MKKIAFITPFDAEHGFALAGVTQHAVTPDKTEGMLRELMQDPDMGLIVIDERLMQTVDEERFRDLEHGWRGVVLALPSPEKAAPEAEDYATRLIRRAIGYHVRMRF